MAKVSQAGTDTDVKRYMEEKAAAAQRKAAGKAAVTPRHVVQPAEDGDEAITAMLERFGLPATPANIADFKRQLIGRLVREQTGVQSLAFGEGPEGFAEMTAVYHIPLIGRQGPKSGKLSFLNDNVKVRFQGVLCTLQTGLYQYEPRDGSKRADNVDVLAEWAE